MSLASGRCRYHPERPGLGICVECRSVICTECTTQFDGINRCAKCLGARLAKSRQLVSHSAWGAGTVFLAALAATGLYLAFLGIASAVAR
jgi:hypothetical protein